MARPGVNTTQITVTRCNLVTRCRSCNAGKGNRLGVA